MCVCVGKKETQIWQVVEVVGYNFRTMQGVVDHVKKKFRFLDPSFKSRLLHHLSFLVDAFNHSFWKRYITSLNDLDPGLDLLEECTRNIMQVDDVEEV